MTCVLDSCNQGRQPCADPAVCCGRSRRVSEADMLRQCARSGQVDSRQIAAHLAAGEFPIGYESADPAHREPVRVAREPLPVSFAGREPFDWSAVARWGAAVAVCVVWTLIVIYRK